MSLFLNNIGVLVTRPAGQAIALCNGIEAAGGHAYHIPTMEITPVEHTAALQQQCQDVCDCDLVIFVSVNAVDYAGRECSDEFIKCLQNKAVAAIGRTTASHLLEHGYQVSIVPEGGSFDSESLLAHPALRDVSGKRVLIVRGEGGRELLAETLDQRGAKVAYLEVYRRLRPDSENTELTQLLQKGRIQVVVTTSNEILQNLYDMLGPTEQTILLQMPLVVMSQRAVALARELGFAREPVIAKEITTDALLDAIEKCIAQ